jgi:hypothetical protein
MANTQTWPKIAVLALLGASAGAHLGWSAIAEIHPARFAAKVPPSLPNADPELHRPGEPPSASLTFSEDRCVGCRTYPEEYHPIQDAAVEGDTQSSPPSNSEDASTRLASSLAGAIVEIARRQTASDRGDHHHAPPVAGTHTNPTAGTNDKTIDEQAPEVNPIYHVRSGKTQPHQDIS